MPEQGQDGIQQLKAELLRLRVKRSEIEDKDIRKAIELQITQLQERIVAMVQAKPVDEEEIEISIDPATPEQIAAADQLVRQARVEKMRKNAQGATDLLRKASEAAPGAPAVLEALGDDLVERRRLKDAAKAYKQAIRFDPTNVGLERKHAMAVMGLASAASIEDALRMGSEQPDNGRVSPQAAMILSVILPGLGQAVLGRMSGYFMIVAWMACLVWINFQIKDVYALMAQLQGGRVTPNMLVLVPIFAMLVIFTISVTTLGGKAKIARPKPVDRPTPPVNLPFE